jgi:exopolyphosphatase/guanosine-5'-triphosphate,3'-diphosphate pyrophosphatase
LDDFDSAILFETEETIVAKYAAIDIGSNSVLMVVAESNGHGHLEELADEGEISRLGEGLQATGFLKPEAMERTIRVLSRFVQVAEDYNVDAIAAVGTMCLREAKNADVFLQTAKLECGLTVEVISGEEEARLAYLAAKHGLNIRDGRFVIFDIGGGSTEFIFGKGEQITRRFSLNLGAIGLTEKYLTSDPVTKEQLARLLEVVAASLDDIVLEGKVAALFGMGGTLTTLGAVMHVLVIYQPEVIHGTVLRFSEVERQMELYRSRTVEQRKGIIGLQSGRADIILAGVGIVYCLMKKLGVDSAIISDRGVRHGLLLDRFEMNAMKAD